MNFRSPYKLIYTYILQPTRITDHSETLTVNVFTNALSVDSISGNLTATIFDHLPQSMIVPNVLSNAL